MGFWDKVQHQLIDIIEWVDETTDTMVYKFNRFNNEIKYGAQLVVRESQLAVFVKHGKIADIFKPGMHTLHTNNLPVLRTIMSWHHGFESPFKAEVYFINIKNFTNLKWGTKNPIMMRAPEFGAVRLRAFGSYVLRIQDPSIFLKEIIGTNTEFTVDGIQDQLRNIVVTRFADMLAESKIPVLDLASQYNELSEQLQGIITPEFLEYGLSITKLLIENITLPVEVEEMLDKRTSMNIVGDMDQFTQFQAATSMEKAAENESGEASGGIGMGMGFAMANNMTQGLSSSNDNQNNASTKGTSSDVVTPPIPENIQYYLAINGEKEGPFTKDVIVEKLISSSISKNTFIWKKGLDNWIEIDKLKDFSESIGNVPPPIPM